MPPSLRILVISVQNVGIFPDNPGASDLQISRGKHRLLISLSEGLQKLQLPQQLFSRSFLKTMKKATIGSLMSSLRLARQMKITSRLSRLRLLERLTHDTDEER